ncbi:MAG: hypothetical protein LC774_07675 [Acidobacteria bacterium]|nr:hypothetical protein [Acidobacteriota bacterium]
MTQSLFYCSELSARSGERVFGTASTGEVWLLVEYPFAWGSRAMESSALSPAIKEHLAALLKTIPRSRLLFVKQDSVCRADFNFFVVRSRARNPYAVRLRLTDYKDLLDLNVAGVAAGDSAGGGEVTREPLLLVCTHGKRDKCCAKFGNPLYKSLRATEGAASVWQSSHVGGDRFAANLVCFPHGLFYARVSEDAGARAAAEYARGRIVLENFRGRACFSHPVQAHRVRARRAERRRERQVGTACGSGRVTRLRNADSGLRISSRGLECSSIRIPHSAI